MNSAFLTPSRLACLLLSSAALAASSSSAVAALAITNGGFGTANTNAVTVSAGGWFESTTSNAWVEGSWFNGGIPQIFNGTVGPALLMDGLGDNSYLYQSLGTLDAGTTTISLSADFLEKSDGNTNTARFDLFLGNPFTGANQSDIFGAAGVTLLQTFTLDAAAQGLTAAAGNVGRANGVLIGTYDASSLPAGSQLWLHITDAADGTDDSGSGGDLMVDNLSLSAVPEPASFALFGLALGTMTLRRRR